MIGARRDDEMVDQQGLLASARRIGAQVLRYWYLIRSSWPRIAELIYWPFVQMLMWGFLQTHLAQNTTLYSTAAGLLIGSLLLWDILVRGQLGFSVSFLEEMWSRNLGHLLMSPLRPNEFIAALMAVSVIRLLIGLIPVALLAKLFFGFNLLGLGLPLVGFFASLILTSWAVGLATTGVILRYGLGAEGVAWTFVFVLLPISCVFYPLHILPGWLQPIALALPPTHVFEGMRALVIEGIYRSDHMLWALGLNVVYFIAGYGVFQTFLRAARVHGSLLVMGE